MRNLIKAELMQLRTLRSTYGVLALVVLMVVGITVAEFSEAGSRQLSSFAELRDALVRDVGLVAAMVFAMFAALRVGGEFRHDTIGQRVLAAPRRGRVVAVKLAVFGALAAVTAAATAALAVPIAKATASSKDVTFALTTGQSAEIVGQVAAGAALFAMIGVAVAVITRSQPAAAMIVLGGFITEQIVAGLVGSAAQYLPFALLNETLGIGDLGTVTAGLALSGLAAAVAATATVLLRRRDVV